MLNIDIVSNEEDNASSPQRILGNLVGQEISQEELKSISGGCVFQHMEGTLPVCVPDQISV